MGISFARTAPSPSMPCSSERRKSVLALIQVTCQNRNITARTFFRSAYLWRFNKDMPPNSLDDDVREYETHYAVPKYVIDYVLHIVGDKERHPA